MCFSEKTKQRVIFIEYFIICIYIIIRLHMEGSRGRKRPRKILDEGVRGDLKAKAIHRDLIQDRVAWKKAII